MRIHQLLFLTCTLTAFGCVKDAPAGTDSGDDSEEETADGGEVYANSCAGCHAADGTGASAPSLVDRVPMLSDEDLMNVIENGTGSMPDMGLSVTESDAVFLYVRGEFGEHGGA